MPTPETVCVEFRESFAKELADVLEAEVEFADEYHSTEQVMEEGAETIRDALRNTGDLPDSDG